MSIIEVVQDQVLKNLIKYLSRQIILILAVTSLALVIGKQHYEISSLKERIDAASYALEKVKQEQERCLNMR